MIKKRISSINASLKELPHRNDPKHPKHVSDKQYKSIMKLFFKKMMYYMIKDGSKFVLPHFLGTLQLVRYDAQHMENKRKKSNSKYTRVMVDFHATKKLKERGINKTVKHTYKTTGGYWWKLHWFKRVYARFKTQKLYSLKLCRPNIRPNAYNNNNPKLSVTPYFRDKGWEIYAEIPKNKK